MILSSYNCPRCFFFAKTICFHVPARFLFYSSTEHYSSFLTKSYFYCNSKFVPTFSTLESSSIVSLLKDFHLRFAKVLGITCTELIKFPNQFELRMARQHGHFIGNQSEVGISKPIRNVKLCVKFPGSKLPIVENVTIVVTH